MTGEVDMGTDDKRNNAVEDAKGKVKEKVGQVTDDEELERQGRNDQRKADMKQAGEKVKDAFKH
jgi:uncharacterized protein YjbJ (UPF0337 family)